MIDRSLRDAIKNKARISKEDIYNKEVERMNADPSIDSIPADKDQVVLDADIKTAKQISEEADSK